MSELTKVAPADLAIHECEAVDNKDKSDLAVKSNKSVFGTPLESRVHKANYC